jgi:adenine-specific DNA glycosylase
MRGDLRSPGKWQELQKTADSLLAAETPGDWNQAMMELGATICTPRSPQCLLCPVGEFCEARKQGITDLIPEKRKKRETVPITLAALVMLDSKGRTLLLPPPKTSTKSAAGLSADADLPTLLSRMWHFPTIHLDGRKAAARSSAECRNSSEYAQLHSFVQSELLGGRKLLGSPVELKKVGHAVTYRAITVLPFLLRVKKLPAIRDSRVLPLADLSTVAISNLTRKVARAALAKL